MQLVNNDGDELAIERWGNGREQEREMAYVDLDPFAC